MFDNIDQVREANERAGHHFFERDTMRFFNSRILDGVYGGRYFITSERFERRPRRYTIREVDDNGHITTVKCGHSYANGDDHDGGFGCYWSSTAAKAKARELARHDSTQPEPDGAWCGRADHDADDCAREGCAL